MKRLTINGILLSVFILFFYAASANAEAVPSKGAEELKSPTASLDKSAALYSNIPLYVVSSDFGPDSNETKKHTRSWGFPHREGVVLVLCGGGMKGLSHVGVFEVLKRENIPVAAIVGTSMGAIMGGLYASGLSPEDIHAKLKDSDLMYIMSGRKNLEIYNNYNSPVPPGDSLISFTSNNGENQEGQLGLLNAKDVYSYLCDLTSHVSVTDFDYLPIPFAATATDLDNGDTVILRNGNLASAMRASMSFPIVFDPWPVNGRLLVDGGLKANLPVLEAKKLFPGHPIVAVNLSPLDISSNNKKFHSILDVAGQTVDILMLGQVRENAEAADLVITPDVAKVGTFSDVNYDEVVNLGIEAAEKMLPQLKELVAEKCHTWAHTPPSGGYHFKRPEVVEVRFVGVPEGIANEFQKRCAGWINQPLDMKKVAETVTQLSNRKDIKAVDGRTENISRDKVAVIFNIERPPKYEFGIDGFASNLYPNPWVSLQATMHDAIMAGDTASLEYRFGSNQGAMLRYFTLESSSDTQWGLILAGRREMYDPSNFVSQEFDRYTARLAWYKQLSPRTRLGLGYAAETVKSLTPDDINRNGPYLSLSFNTLDDPVLPTRGLIFDTSLWFPFNHRAVTATDFKLFVPVKKFGRVTIGGGLKTGDAENLAFAATLGSRLELYSLGQHPLVGDQAYWVHLGFEKNLMRSWWGGINVEIFGNYGQVMDGWTNSGSHWEVGAALSVPTNKFGGKLLLIYDQNDEFIIGYTIGMPRFWDGPMP